MELATDMWFLLEVRSPVSRMEIIVMMVNDNKLIVDDDGCVMDV